MLEISTIAKIMVPIHYLPEDRVAEYKGEWLGWIEKITTVFHGFEMQSKGEY